MNDLQQIGCYVGVRKDVFEWLFCARKYFKAFTGGVSEHLDQPCEAGAVIFPVWIRKQTEKG